MRRRTSARKVVVTIDAAVHREVLGAARAEGKSVSAWLTAAAGRALLGRDGLAAVAEWELDHGAFSRVELEAARSRIERPTRRRRSKR